MTKKKAQVHQYVASVRTVRHDVAVVTASSEDEARAKICRLEWDDLIDGEIADVSVSAIKADD